MIDYQVAETCDPQTPHLITHIQTTPATTPDREQLPEIHRALAHKELLPSEHLVDAGYPDSGILADSPREHGVQVIGPAPPDTAWQAQLEGAFDVACFFTIDWEEQRAICPTGHASIHWSPSKDNRGKEMINIQFSRRDCQVCPQRAVCTISRNGRRLSVRRSSTSLCRPRANSRRLPRSRSATTRVPAWRAPSPRAFESATCAMLDTSA